MNDKEVLIAELRTDVRRWKEELVRLRAEGHDDIVARIEGWVARTERVLARLNV
jgi:prephenate dehydrogenase